MLLAQQDWKTVVNLPGVDFSGLSPVKTRALLRLLRNHDCACGCGMKVAECRVKDPNCAWSKGLAAAMGDAIRAGKDENEAIEAAKASKWAKGPKPPKLLDDPVTIPTVGSPVRGPEGAILTLVEFSDFQCPYCWIAVTKLNALLEAYPGEIKLIFRSFPWICTRRLLWPLPPPSRPISRGNSGLCMMPSLLTRASCPVP